MGLSRARISSSQALKYSQYRDSRSRAGRFLGRSGPDLGLQVSSLDEAWPNLAHHILSWHPPSSQHSPFTARGTSPSTGQIKRFPRAAKNPFLVSPLTRCAQGPPLSQDPDPGIRRSLTYFRDAFSRAMQRTVTQMDTPEPRKSQYCSVS